MKKQLLKESEIRKMMKFANIGALSNNFVEKLNETWYGDDDVTEAIAAEDDEEIAADTGADTGGQTLDTGEEVGGLSEPALPDDEAGLDTEVPMTGPEGTTEPIDVDPAVLKQAVKSIVDGLEKTMKEMYGEEAPGLEATEVEDDAAVEEPPVEEPAGEEVGGMTTDTGEEVGGMSLPADDEGLEEDFINEMTRKVAARLVRASKRRKRR